MRAKVSPTFPLEKQTTARIRFSAIPTTEISAISPETFTLGINTAPNSIGIQGPTTIDEGEQATLILTARGITDPTTLTWEVSNEDAIEVLVGAKAIAAGGFHTCAIKTDGSIVCWGNPANGRTNPPAGQYTAIDADRTHSCAIKTDQSIECWGFDGGRSPDGRVSNHPTVGKFTHIAAGDDYSCAIKTDKSIICWGSSINDKTNPPAGQYIDIAAGGFHSCAIKTDQSIECWGYDGGSSSDGRVSDHPTIGRFTHITAGGAHTCAIKTDQSIECWGNNVVGQIMSIPAGQYIDIAAGLGHTCAIKTDQSIECWGYDGDPPDGRVINHPTIGRFTAIDLGRSHSCAIKTDRSIACWGNNGNGRSTPPPDVTARSIIVQTDGEIAITIRAKSTDARPGKPTTTTIRFLTQGQAATIRPAQFSVVTGNPYLIGFTPAQLTLQEGTSGQVTINVTPTPAQNTSLPLTVIIQPADQAHIKAIPAEFILSDSTPQASFLIQASDDNIFEQESTYTVTLATPDDILSRRSNQLTVTIPANDTPTIIATLAHNELAEADTTTLTITAQNVTVMLTLDLQADDPLSLGKTQITFSQDGTQTITVTAVDDAGVIPTARTVKATITLAPTPKNIIITPQNQFTIAITDNDNLAICAALDIPPAQCPQFLTPADSDAPWRIVQDNTAEGGRALRSGAITHDQISCIGFTHTRPFVLAFNWRVSSEKTYDSLRYYQDRVSTSRDVTNTNISDTPGVRISGSSPYRRVTKPLTGAGDATMEWCFTKDADITRGADAGWLDNLHIANNLVSASLSRNTMLKSGRITLVVDAPIVSTATTITLSAEPEGITLSSTLLHFTQTTKTAVTITAKNVVIPPSTQQLRSTITLSANDETALQITTLTFDVNSDTYNNTLCTALDITTNCPELFTSADSDAPWFIVKDKTATGDQALRSGAITDNHISCIGFTHTRPFVLTFNWRVSSENNFDFLRYYHNSMPANRDLRVRSNNITNMPGVRISGESPTYLPVTKRFIDTHSNTIEWCFTKDTSIHQGDDAGWLDNVAIRNFYQIGFNPAVLTLTEGQTTAVAIIITPTPRNNIALTLTSSSPTQLSISPAKVTIPQGATSAQVAITATDDDKQQSEQIYTVTVTASDHVVIETSSSLTVIIPANDTPTPTIKAELTPNTISEGDQTLLTLTAQHIPIPATITLTSTGAVTVSSTIVLTANGKTTAAVTADDDNIVMTPQRAATITLDVTPASITLPTTQLTLTITEDDPYLLSVLYPLTPH